MENLIKIKSQAGVQLTDHELAFRWWERLQRVQKQTLLNQYAPNMKIEHMFIDDIYWVWLKQQTL
jgi:hypothetical protein